MEFNCLFYSISVLALLGVGLSTSAARVIASSLYGREFMVVSGDRSFFWRRFDHRVEQGRRLGPILYIITANQYPSLLHSGCRYHLLADDSIIEFLADSADILGGVATLQSNLDAVQKWSSRLGLLMNFDKMVFLCFGAATSVANALSHDLFIEVAERRVLPASEVKYLGV